MTNFLEYVATLGGLGLLIILIAEAVDRPWHLDGWPARIRTWFIGIILGLLGLLINIGIFASAQFPVWMAPWLGDVILGFAAALLGNVGFDKIEYFKLALEAIGIRVPAKTVPTVPPGSQ